MKKILITGKNSYVGNSFETWMTENYPDDYLVEKISLRDYSWRYNDFSKYDVVLHVAGIAHRKEIDNNRELYFKVNRDLTFEVAKKAKNSGVSQFIFISSMSVYGLDTGVITHDTKLQPKNNYGKSKLEAEKLIVSLNDVNFKVAIVRPPMIYGKGCKGNYVRLSKLAKKTFVFPKVMNRRSMIYIDNLSLYIKYLIDYKCEGLYFPQNPEYINTSEMVLEIANAHEKKVFLTKAFNPLIFGIFRKNQTVNKVFGSLIYDMELTDTLNLQFISFKESIKQTES